MSFLKYGLWVQKLSVKCAYEFPFTDGSTYFTEVLNAVLPIDFLSYPNITGQEVTWALQAAEATHTGTP